MAWNWPPLFVVPDHVVGIEVIAVGDQPEHVTVHAGPTQLESNASFDMVLERWTAAVDIPANVADRIYDFTATAFLGEDAPPSIVLSVPVVNDTNVISPTVFDAAPVVVAELSYGSQDDQIGFEIPESDIEIQLPQSLKIDEATGNIVLLDSVNRRLLVMTPSGDVTDVISLPGKGRHEDVVFFGDARRALVSEWLSSDGNVHTYAHSVDLDTGAVDSDGPYVITQSGVPANTELIWNEADQAIFGVIYAEYTGLYRYYDTDQQKLDVSTTPERWWEPFVGSDGNTVGLRQNGIEIMTALPHGYAGVINEIVKDDGSFVWLAGAVEEDNFGSSGVHYYLGHTNPACHASNIIEIELSSISELATQVLAVDESSAFVANIALNGYRLERYDLPQNTC